MFLLEMRGKTLMKSSISFGECIVKWEFRQDAAFKQGNGKIPKKTTKIMQIEYKAINLHYLCDVKTERKHE